jgi:hypothetical protein
MIVKVQVSLSGKPATLIYNQDRTVFIFEKRKVGEDVLGKDLKGFFEAAVRNKKLVIGKRVKTQSW